MTVAELSALIQGLAPAVRDFVHSTQKALSDRITALETQDQVPGKDGEPGPAGEKGVDGKDGLGFDDIQVEFDGERSFSLKFIRGDQVKTFGAFRVPAQIYRGVFEEGHRYEKQDVVTWGGSMWFATADTTVKPGLASQESREAWVMCVRRGAEGKTGAQGPIGKQGLMGPQGPTGIYK